MSIVFISCKDNHVLKDSIGFDQYILNTNHLITVIGEYHWEKSRCKERNTKSISRYALERLSKNPNLNIYLEVDSNLIKPRRRTALLPYSIPIREIISGVVTERIYDSPVKNIIGFDIRDTLLKNYRVMLYEDDSKLTQKDILEIKQCFYKNKDKFNICSSIYTKKVYTFLKKYLHSIENELHKVKTRSDIYNLKIIWVKITDFFILKNILKKNQSNNESIVICGDYHRKNISQCFRKLKIPNIVSKKKNNTKCIQLFETLVVNEY